MDEITIFFTCQQVRMSLRHGVRVGFAPVGQHQTHATKKCVTCLMSVWFPPTVTIPSLARARECPRRLFPCVPLFSKNHTLSNSWIWMEEKGIVYESNAINKTLDMLE